MNCAHIHIFQKKKYCFKSRVESLRPILAKIELISQQPAMTRPTGVLGLRSPAVWCWIWWLGADAVIWILFKWCRVMAIHKCYAFSLKCLSPLSPTPEACGPLLDSIQHGEVRDSYLVWGLWSEPMLISYKWGPVTITWWQFHNRCFSRQSRKLDKNTSLNVFSKL